MGNNTIVITTEKRFYLNSTGKIVDKDNTRAATFWQRYLSVFGNVVVVARLNHTEVLENSNYVEGNGIMVAGLPDYQGLLQGMRRYFDIRREIELVYNKYERASFLLRLPGSIGDILCKVLEKNNRQYSIELVGDPYEVFSSRRSFVSKIIAYQSRLRLRHCVTHAHSVAYVTKEYLQKVYPFSNGFQTYYSSIELNPNFLLKGEKSFADTPLLLVGVGSLEFPYKGVNILLEALLLLAKRGIDFHCTWIGSGRLLKKYENKISGTCIQSRVDFVGSIANEEIAGYFEKNNIFILPSLTEGLPRAMIEAMASGLICLGSNVGGIPELISDECIFSAGDPKAIVDKLIDVKSRYDHFKMYSFLNCERAREYLPNALEKKRIELFESMS